MLLAIGAPPFALQYSHARANFSAVNQSLILLGI